MSLSASDHERGFVEFACDVHGFLLAALPSASVWCACGKRARRVRHGRLLDPVTLKPTGAKARTLNAQGFPFIHGCDDCSEDFGGVYLQRVHRVGRGESRHCLSTGEMLARGWHRDPKGRWRRPTSEALAEHTCARSSEGRIAAVEAIA